MYEGGLWIIPSGCDVARIHLESLRVRTLLSLRAQPFACNVLRAVCSSALIVTPAMDPTSSYLYFSLHCCVCSEGKLNGGRKSWKGTAKSAYAATRSERWFPTHNFYELREAPSSELPQQYPYAGT